MIHSSIEYRLCYAQTLSSRGLSHTLISIVQVTSWFDSVFIRVACCVNFRKTVTLRVRIRTYFKLYRKVCINDKDRNRTKQHVCNSIDPQQMLDRGMTRLDAIRYGQIRINAFSYVSLPTITDRPSAHAFLTVMKICPRIYRALRIRYVQLRMRYESLRIGRTDTEHLSAASAAYVSPSVT